VLGVKVPRALAEEFRVTIARKGVVDKTLAILDEGDSVLIPVHGPPPAEAMGKYHAVLVERDFPSRRTRVDPIDQVRASIGVPEELKLLLPEKWEQLGDVVTLRLPKELGAYERQVGEAYASVLKAKTVLRDVGGIAGSYRTPVVRAIFGDDAVAVHRENGILYKLDASKVMFSSGNVDERMRMATVACDGETVVDMFAGIGYFTLPLAVHQRPRRVISCELNEVAYGYLVENVALNKVEGRVEPILGDNRDLPGEGFADRVVMGYVKTTHEFLQTAFRLLKSGGAIHYHETCPNDLLPDRPVQRLRAAARGDKVEVLRFREVKSYSPGVSHVVVDARFTRTS
jgi:tRNA wybutosine-synthesizing protein 2